MAPSDPNDPLMIFDRSYPATFLTTCAAGLGDLPVHRRDLDADDEIARRAEAMALRAAVVGGQQTAYRGGLGERRIEREPLAALPQQLVDGAQPGAGLDAHRQVAAPVLEDAVDARHVEEDVERRRHRAPAELRAAAANHHRQRTLAGPLQRRRNRRARLRFDDDPGQDPVDGVGMRIGRTGENRLPPGVQFRGDRSRFSHGQ